MPAEIDWDDSGVTVVMSQTTDERRKALNASYMRAYRRRKTDERDLHKRLDFVPLEAALVRAGVRLTSVMSGASLRRYRLEGIPLYRADELACRYGWHPFDIWGPDWLAIAETSA